MKDVQVVTKRKKSQKQTSLKVSLDDFTKQQFESISKRKLGLAITHVQL